MTNSAIGKYVKVSPASATNMVKKLAELDLVQHNPYESVKLTESGEKVALEVLRHHRLLELYLHKELKMPWDQVHAEAEKLEHVISEALEDAIANVLGNPTVDPHGDPIPSKEGHVEQVSGILLSQAELHQPYALVRVLIQEQERLSYLGSLQLYPNAKITLLERAPFNGPLLIDVNGKHHAFSYDMAQYLLVQSIDESLA